LENGSNLSDQEITRETLHFIQKSERGLA